MHKLFPGLFDTPCSARTYKTTQAINVFAEKCRSFPQNEQANAGVRKQAVFASLKNPFTKRQEDPSAHHFASGTIKKYRLLPIF